MSSIISILKDMKSSLSSSTIYRGITLFNIIGKAFDYAILMISNNVFRHRICRLVLSNNTLL